MAIERASLIVRATIPLCFAFAYMPVHAQQDSTRSQIVTYVTDELRRSYVDRYMAQVMADSLNALYHRGHYDDVIYSDEFVHCMTETLRAISGDVHINVRMVHPYMGSTRKVIRTWKIRPLQRIRNRMRHWKYRRRISKDMFDYGTVAILPGGIGYLELFSFDRTTGNRKYNRKYRIPWSSIVRKLQGTNCLIVDLREHRGGYTDMTTMFLSSFIPQRSVYLVTGESWREHASTRKNREVCLTKRFHTTGKYKFRSVNNKRIVALTSSHTFSAGEWGAYGLQQRANALIIGETTAGAGNGSQGGHSTPLVEMLIPSVHLYDEENQGFTIEGAGVTPDVLTTMDSALVVAYRKLDGQGSLENAFDMAKYIHRPIATDNADLLLNSPEECELLRGDYYAVKVECNEGGLYVSFDLGLPAKILTDETGRYMISGVELMFLREADGRACEVHIVYPDGYIEKYRRREIVGLSNRE